VADLLSDSHSEASAEIRHRVTRARDRQTERYGSVRARTNGDLTRRELGLFCQVGDDEKQLLSRAISRFRLSARGYDRVRRVARTLADLDDSEAIRASHVTEALAYRGIRPES
jgi:magnesium chelatase family protein